MTRHATRPGLVMAILRRDLGQVHRHGLAGLVAVTVLLLFMGLILFQMAGDTFKDKGEPTWTGDIAIGGEGGDLLVEATADVMMGTAPLTAHFGSSVDGDEGHYTYSWDFGDKSSSSETAPVHTYQEPGSYNVYLTVTAEGGAKGTSVAMSVVARHPSDTWLQVVIHVNRTEGPSPLEVAFASGVAGGVPPYTYVWTFDDGNTSATPSPGHAFPRRDRPYNVSLTVRDSASNESRSNWYDIEPWKEEGEGDLPFSLLSVVFGFAVLVTAVLLPMAFSSAYLHEIKKGTVRTLVCYPVGVLEVTVSKVAFAAVVGGVLSFIAFALPTATLEKPFGERLGVFLVAYVLTLVTVIVGALVATSMAHVTRRMYLRPTSLPKLFVALSVLTTELLFTGIAFLATRDIEAGASMVDAWAPVIALSPYHQGGALLSAALGGPSSANAIVFAVPAVLLVIGTWLTKRVLPDVYEKE